ncbi:hypothetical protein M422DRAFT_162008, partial [Sphaerobolus stellatus SS14]
YLTPKFHLPGHGAECQTRYLHNLAVKVGCTDGECVECGWVVMNPVANATKEMSPGHCKDTLEDHWGSVNWMKTVELGSLSLGEGYRTVSWI